VGISPTVLLSKNGEKTLIGFRGFAVGFWIAREGYSESPNRSPSEAKHL
jgi:hypothetical protein